MIVYKDCSQRMFTENVYRCLQMFTATTDLEVPPAADAGHGADDDECLQRFFTKII